MKIQVILIIAYPLEELVAFVFKVRMKSLQHPATSHEGRHHLTGVPESILGKLMKSNDTVDANKLSKNKLWSRDMQTHQQW